MSETKERIREKLTASGISGTIEGDNIIVTFNEGRIIVNESGDRPAALGKLNFTGKMRTGVVVFLVIVIADNHFSGDGNDIYFLFLILESLYLLYCHLIIEIRRLQVEKILRT